MYHLYVAAFSLSWMFHLGVRRFLTLFYSSGWALLETYNIISLHRQQYASKLSALKHFKISASDHHRFLAPEQDNAYIRNIIRKWKDIQYPALICSLSGHQHSTQNVEIMLPQ